MTHPLDGVYIKLARAETHLQAIREAVQPIVDAEADVILGEFDPESKKYVFRAKRDAQPPDWISPVIGDCVHNMRAALDYIIWELVPESVRVGKYATQIEFPIFIDPSLYASMAPKKIQGVPPGAETAIKCLQPFNGPNCRPNLSLAHPSDKPLARLFALDNWDKHRSLTLTQTAVSYYFEGLREIGIFAPRKADSHAFSGHLKRGAPILSLDGLGDRPEVNVYLHTAYDVAFDVGGPAFLQPVVRTLIEIREDILGRVLPALAQFFPARP